MSQPLIGAPLDRVEGPLKVTGRAAYTGDHRLPGMVHAVIVESAIAKGRIASIDASAAEALPGVLAVITHRNAPRIQARKTNEQDSNLFLLQSDEVEFDRQPIAVAVAETFEAAMQAAQLVRAAYQAQTPTTALEAGARFLPEKIFDEPANHYRGDAARALAQADAKVAQIYRTPTEHHNPMETHGTVASWEGGGLLLYDSTQWPFGVRRRIAATFGIAASEVRVVAPFVGGAFGSKGQTWSHVPLAALAAKIVRRPVKLLVTRPQMFGWVGHRPQTRQTVSLGADRTGRLAALTHSVLSETSISDEFVEPCAVFSRDLYAVPNFAMSDALSRLNISKPTYQRGPGESTGTFALESAMDELSYQLGIDPLELRLGNYSENNPDSGKPYSSKRLRECYAQAAERFGWSARIPKTRSTSRGRLLVGMGMSTASRAVHRSAASVRMRMDAAGNVLVQCGTIEQGTGSPTVFPQLAAEILGISPRRVRFEWGNTDLPDAPIAAGSQTAASVGSAVVGAAQHLREQLAAAGGTPPAAGIEVRFEGKPSAAEEAFATQSFGANFAEVEVDPDVGTVRVTRFVGAFEGGRILNAKTARSQLLGGIVWGISMALFEQTLYDARTGRIMNANL